MSQLPLLVEVTNDILVVTLNRPEKLNSLSKQMLEMFEKEVLNFRDTPTLKVMLIRAAGRYFCAGADLKEAQGHGVALTTATEAREMHRIGINNMRRIWNEMEAIEKPFVVAHHATCMGGGLEMSLSCDFRLAAKSASYAFPEAKQGLLPATNGVSRLTRLVGTQWARYMIMANLPVDAQLALTMGLVQAVYPDETFEEDVMGFCRHLARQNAETMGAAKLAIELAYDFDRAQAANVERMVNSTLILSPEHMAIRESHFDTIGDATKRV